jgi:hypothetical protein
MDRQGKRPVKNRLAAPRQRRRRSGAARFAGHNGNAGSAGNAE